MDPPLNYQTTLQDLRHNQGVFCMFISKKFWLALLSHNFRQYHAYQQKLKIYRFANINKLMSQYTINESIMIAYFLWNIVI